MPDQLVGRFFRRTGVCPILGRFNPRPTDWSGDFGGDMDLKATDTLFQSTPDQLVERFLWTMEILNIQHGVSIHARPIGRAI